jgi:hypothetical protein
MPLGLRRSRLCHWFEVSLLGLLYCLMRVGEPQGSWVFSSVGSTELNFTDKYNLKDLFVTLKTHRGGILFRLKKTL